MKKQIIKIDNEYFSRYKKWYHLRWRYLGINEIWMSNVGENRRFNRCDSEQDALFKFVYFGLEENKENIIKEWK